MLLKKLAKYHQINAFALPLKRRKIEIRKGLMRQRANYKTISKINKDKRCFFENNLIRTIRVIIEPSQDLVRKMERLSLNKTWCVKITKVQTW